ncbi:drug/metabolite DMT transporter permease [Salmonella enterica subsp. enterica serovar Stanley]|nr:drug/metabolite DMT transporter permease [Salmonella enterica subsp. enterica serovar Stanley]
MTSQKATLIGLVAIVLWSTMVGLIRGVSEGLGPVGGAAMIYSLSGLLLIFTVGLPDIRRFPGRYLIAGSVLFVSYEICLALSLGYAATRHQAIEVGMVNYLWPSLTILFAILFNGQKTNWLIVPGLLIALTGVCWVLGGENGLNPGEIISNVATSPLSYLLAFLGAFIWATYCTVTNKYARGFNGITVFVLLTAVALWFHYFLTPQPAMIFSLPVIAKLFTAALTLGFAYAAWNVGILHGNDDYHGRRVLFYPRHVLCSGSAVTQLTTVILLLARRSHGLRRFTTLLAGNAAALIATGGPMLILNRPAVP